MVPFILILGLVLGCDSKERPTETEEKVSHTTNTTQVTKPLPPPTPKKVEQNITLTDLHEKEHSIHIAKQRLILKDINQPYILLHFFNPKSPATLSYLTQLQQENRQNLFIASILLENNLNQEAFDAFQKEHNATHFTSYSYNNALVYTKLLNTFTALENSALPLSILFKQGTYYRHYEGEVPIEMIQHDLNYIKH
jgi:hypothetical protein